MDFFEQLGKKLTDAGQNVVQQTKSIADVVRLNSEVSAKERAITQLYIKIGQAYYDRHKNDSDAEDFQTISEIYRLYKEIAQCQETIKRIKGVTKCPGCGADVPMGAAFCNVCGEQIPASIVSVREAQGSKKCPNCHSDVDEDNAFCVFCGTKLD